MSNGNGRSTGGFEIGRDSSALLIVATALRHGVTDHRQIAYMLATAQHETRNFTAPEEDYGRSQARKLGYSGGEDFYGRGYVHLTHDYNYRKFDELLGLGGELIRNPDRAREPELAAEILVLGMRDGLFTGRRLDRYINEGSHDTYNARRVVNGITKQTWTTKAAEDCERYSIAWERSVPQLIEESRKLGVAASHGWSHSLQQTLGRILQQPLATPDIRDGLPDYLRVQSEPRAATTGELREGTRGSSVHELQQALHQLGIRDGQGRPLAIDGIFGSSTRQAVENFQLWHGLDTSGVADRETRDLLDDPRIRTAMVAGRSGGVGDAADPLATGELRDPGHPSHPDHAMYERIRAGVRAIGERSGTPWDDASERLSRCLLARCKGASTGPDHDAAAGPGVVLRRIDHVVMGTSGNVFAVEGRLDDPAQRRAWVSVAEAALAPVEESDRRLAEANAHAVPEHHVGLRHASPSQASPQAMGHPA